MLPTAERTSLWFVPNKSIDAIIKEKFGNDMERAIGGDYAEWEQAPRGRLALIIIFDQFSRHIFRDTPLAFAKDETAQQLAVTGLDAAQDQSLTLMERVFYYMPLVHAEDIQLQKLALKKYQELALLSMPEVAGIYQSILEYANQHYNVIQRFGRFPHRNEILQRESTQDELRFIEQSVFLG